MSVAHTNCRDDGRCQYAIDHGAEGMAACVKCVMPRAAHTEGRRSVVPGSYGTSKLVLQLDQHLALAAHMREPDARRLAACWNALDGLPTALLEKHGATRSGIYRGTAEINDQLAAARALLTDLIDIEGPQPGNAAWADKVRAFLKGRA